MTEPEIAGLAAEVAVLEVTGRDALDEGAELAVEGHGIAVHERL